MSGKCIANTTYYTKIKYFYNACIFSIKKAIVINFICYVVFKYFSEVKMEYGVRKNQVDGFNMYTFS